MSEGKERIAVVGGTGALGKALALRLAKAGYPVVVGSRDAAKAAETARALGHDMTAQQNLAAAQAGDIVILAVPYAAQHATVDEIRTALAGKIFVDATAPLIPPQVSRVQLPAGGSAVAAIQAMLGEDVRVVSAFQNVSAQKLASAEPQIECDVLVCGNDRAARQRVIDLAGEIGLRGIDAGAIANSAAAEALTSVLIAINRRYKVPGAGIRIVGLDDQ